MDEQVQIPGAGHGQTVSRRKLERLDNADLQRQLREAQEERDARWTEAEAKDEVAEILEVAALHIGEAQAERGAAIERGKQAWEQAIKEQRPSANIYSRLVGERRAAERDATEQRALAEMRLAMLQAAAERRDAEAAGTPPSGQEEGDNPANPTDPANPANPANPTNPNP